MGLICTGCNCPKSRECGLCITNLSYKYTGELSTVENLATFGTTTALFDSINVTTFFCGPNGDYRMFEPIRDEAAQSQLAELTHEVDDYCKEFIHKPNAMQVKEDTINNFSTKLKEALSSLVCLSNDALNEVYDCIDEVGNALKGV